MLLLKNTIKFFRSNKYVFWSNSETCLPRSHGVGWELWKTAGIELEIIQGSGVKRKKSQIT